MPKRANTSKSVPKAQLANWRKRMGFSQRAASEFLRVPFRTYQNWEAGRPQGFPDWLRQQMKRPKKEAKDDPAQLSLMGDER